MNAEWLVIGGAALAAMATRRATPSASGSPGTSALGGALTIAGTPPVASPTVTPPGGTTATGGFVPFWNGTGVQLGNGNMVLPDGRVVTPDGTVTGTLDSDQTTKIYAATQAQAGGGSTAILKAALKTALNPRTYQTIMRVVDGGSPTAQAGMAQQMLRDPGLIDVVAFDDIMSSHVLELSEVWYTPEVVNLGDFIAADPVFEAVGGFDLGFDATLDVGWLNEMAPPADFASPDLGGFFDGGSAIEHGMAAGDVSAVGEAGGTTTAAGGASGFTMGGITISIAVIGAVVGALINIGFSLASDMPDDMKAVSIALDVLNLALVFIPVVGWALALIASFFKSSIVKLFAPDLTHNQREMLELATVLEKTQGLYKYYVRRAVSPSLLYEGIARYNRGDTLHEQLDAVAISIRYLSVDGRWKIVRPAALNVPREDGMVQHGGSWVWPGNPQDFVNSLALLPEGFSIRIQAGVAIEKLEPANTYLEAQVQQRALMIFDAQAGDATALKVLAHVWHITRDPVLNVRAWLDGSSINPVADRRDLEGTVATEMPLLTEVLLSLYYNDLSLYWGFTRLSANGSEIGDWRKLVGVVIQPQWTAYHDLAMRGGRMPTLGGFLDYLGESDILALRQHVFEGRYPVEGATGVADFEGLALRTQRLESNLDTAWTRACMAEPYPYPDADWQGVYGGRVDGATIKARHLAWQLATNTITTEEARVAAAEAEYLRAMMDAP